MDQVRVRYAPDAGVAPVQTARLANRCQQLMRPFTDGADDRNGFLELCPHR